MKTAAQVLSWASTLVVARLLHPSDYGITGMAAVYIGFVQLLNEFGLSAAVVQRRDLTEDQIARLGGVSILLGVALSVISIAASPLVAAFFDQPAVRQVVLVLSVTFITSGFQVLPRSLLSRDLQFRHLAAMDGTEAVLNTAVTFILALLGFGYWSLVLGGVSGRLASTIVGLVLRRHRLAWPTPISSIADALTFGSQLAASNVAWYVFRNADMTVVGRRLGEAALGVYTFGWNIASLPVDRLSSLIARATPAVFSHVQTDPAALRRYVVALTEGMALMTVPAAVGLALVAGDFVEVVLGPVWRPAITALRILSLASIFRSTVPILAQVLVATGQSRRTMQGTIGIAIVLPGLFVLAARWGIEGVALVWLVVFPIASFLFYVRFALSTCHLTPGAYLMAMCPSISAAALMTPAVLMTHQGLIAAPAALRFGGEVAAGALVYGVAVYLMYRRRPLQFVTMLRNARGVA